MFGSPGFARNFFKFLKYTLLFFASGPIETAHAQVIIAAHRGGSYAQFPESSLALFTATSNAFGKDTVYIEIDLRRSKDGTIYLMHDPTADRTTNGSGKLEDLDDKYLNSLRLKTKDGNITNEHILTLEEILSFIKRRKVNLMLDIKSPIYKEALDQVKKHKLEDRMLVLTFQNPVTVQVAEASQNVLISALIETEEAWKRFEEVPVKTGKRVAYITSKTPASLVTRLRKENVLIMADVSEDLRHDGKPLKREQYRAKVQEQNLDILISDFPVEAREALKR
ncbi:glycerophosphodiester phosphodiesterase family protein [Dyadobacter psychrophilus]|uniref:Glycerophosphoryl diester phosphodiesterase n=1 Tax=Dyadobacter psychrophilus TaxID=651661 RepID=A0A1T5DZ99_9BACT|nr:glycerophosphodiester phosphodiesterase family protein [Dyadobacter psychrophilus]SKB76975.1 glycerophosphoryl diester phosphodiesterase [Dyadobacter psychrophilus]